MGCCANDDDYDDDDDERRPVCKVDKLTTILCRCHEIWGT